MKAYTDIKQSKKLAEILPLDSADMSWYKETELFPFELHSLPYSKHFVRSDIDDELLPCWSLAALLDILPSGQVNFIRLPLNGENRYAIQVLCGEEWKIGDWKSNPIDACVEMILKLNEQKLL